MGYKQAKTWLNSGNAVFLSDENDEERIAGQIAVMIKNQFGLSIPVFVIDKEELEDILRNAPDWWGNEETEIHDNLIFIMPPATFADVLNEIGEPKKELEKIQEYKQAIFWSFSRKDYQKQTGGQKQRVRTSAAS